MTEWSRRRTLVGLLVAVTLALATVLLDPRSVLQAAVALTDSRGFLVVLGVLFVVRPFLAVPMSLLTVVVGWRYGLVVGFPIAVVGTAVTTVPPYCVGRYLRTDAGLVGQLCRTGERALDAAGDLRGMVAARLSPAPAEGVSYGAGAAGVAPTTYVVGTVVGELPWTVGYLLLGRSMQELSLDGVALDYRLLLATGLLAVLVVAPAAVRSLRRRSEGGRGGAS